MDSPAWDAELGCVCDAGMPCKCNETNEADEPGACEITEEKGRRH